jgi:hypothetical protein
MTKNKKAPPACFSQLDVVFPLGKDGLRHTPENCLVCFCKIECLRAALRGSEGIKVQKERVKRAYSAGMIGFVERWSRKKNLKRQKKICK